MLSCSPVSAVLVAVRAVLTVVKESWVLETSAFKAKAAAKSEVFTKGAEAVITSALEAKGATMLSRRALLTKGATAAERSAGCTAVATFIWRSSMAEP